MLNYLVTKCDEDILLEAKRHFGANYSDKNNLTRESLIGRFLVSKLYKKIYGKDVFSLEALQNGAPVPFDGVHWSVSHKYNNHTLYAGAVISKKTVGIDVEYLKLRSKELLNFFKEGEYEILGEKNWLNFYKIWTSKEALVKKLNLNLNSMQKITLINKNKLSYCNEYYHVNTIISENIIYSIV